MLNEKSCLNLCKSRHSCKWFTFSSRDRSCQLFENCLELKECPDCKSGHVHCTEPKCKIQGACAGINIAHDKSPESADDCLKLCILTSKCEWFTFYKEVPKCILFESCSHINSTCENCFSGEKACRGKLLLSMSRLTFCIRLKQDDTNRRLCRHGQTANFSCTPHNFCSPRVKFLKCY